LNLDMSVLRVVLRESDERLTDCVGLGVMTRVVSRDLVDEVLNSTERVEKRSRLLPARVVVYYVLALTLFYGDAYEEVLRKLVNGLRFLRAWRNDWTVPTTGAISKARIRLGAKPVRELFFRVAVPLAAPATRGAWFGDLRVMAIDGVILDAADTPENVERFTKAEHQDGESAFPQVRVVGLVECGTHAMVAAEVDSWRVGERELTERLLDHFEPTMLVLADRGFFSYGLWTLASDTGAALVWRVTAALRLPVLAQYPDGSYLSELLPKRLKADLNSGKKRRVPEGARIPVRVVEYRIGNRKSPEVIRLVTTILDHEHAPAVELAALYAERWEFEMGLDEIETHQIANSRVLRSKKPDLVEQEIWGLLITHYVIRHLMHQAADTIDIDEDRLSFIRSLRVVRRSIVNDADFPPTPG
jgi:hypothetical protein